MKIKSKLLLLAALTMFVTGCGAELPSINSISDLEGRKIGAHTGSEFDQIIEEHIQDGEPVYFNNYNDQISALKAGKIDGFLVDEPLAKEILKQNDGIRMLEGRLTEDSYAFAINPELNDLQSDINRVLGEMKEDGSLESFDAKWFGDDEDAKKLEVYEKATSGKKINFATVSASAPFAYLKDNEIVGYDIDIIMYIANELNYEIEIVEMAFEGILPALVSGKVDVAGCSIIVTEERKKSVLFSDPDYTGGLVIITRE